MRAEFSSFAQRAQQWPVLAWLSPEVPVKVLRADGSEAVWYGARWRPSSAKPSKAIFEAVELPAHIFLERHFALPLMPPSSMAQALTLEAASVSPFPSEDLVWGYQSSPRQRGGGYQIDMVLASRKQVAEYLATKKGRLHAAQEPEVWALLSSGQQRVVLAGWGEVRREQHCAQQRRLNYLLILAILILGAGIAVTPIAQLRLRAIDAAYAYSNLQARTAPIASEREAFVKTVDRLNLLRGVLVERVDGLALMEILTQTLADDTSLNTLEVTGLKVKITGLTSNAASLMQQLGTQRGFKDVRAPIAAVRNPGATLDSFNIEFQLDPAAFSVAASPNKVPTTENPAASAGTPEASAPSAAPDPTPPASGAGAPVTRSRFSSGMDKPPVASAPSSAAKGKTGS